MRYFRRNCSKVPQYYSAPNPAAVLLRPLQATIHIFKGITGGELNIYGDKGTLNINHGGAYVCFRSQLVDVIRSFKAGKSRLDYSKTYNIINALVAAKESLENQGKKIKLGS